MIAANGPFEVEAQYSRNTSDMSRPVEVRADVVPITLTPDKVVCPLNGETRVNDERIDDDQVEWMLA